MSSTPPGAPPPTAIPGARGRETAQDLTKARPEDKKQPPSTLRYGRAVQITRNTENIADVRIVGVEILEHYEEFVPRLDYKRKIAEVLGSIPPATLLGLSAVVLRDTHSLTRRERKFKARTKGGRAPLSEVMATYRSAHGNRPAHIELFMDEILSHWPSWIRFVPVVRYEIIHSVLFHELGHHVQAPPRNIKEQSECRADDIAAKMRKDSFRNRHPLLVPLVRLTYKVGSIVLDILRIPHGQSQEGGNR